MGFGEVPAHGRLALAATALALAIGWADVAAQAQEAPPAEAATEQPPTTAEQPATSTEQPVTTAEQPATAEVPAQTDLLAPEQLDILVSPVALYPDPLLVLVLQGSTFPVEVIAANRFLGELAEQPYVVLSVAEARRETPEATLGELAERLGIHRSAVQRALERVERLALVPRDSPTRKGRPRGPGSTALPDEAVADRS